MHQFVAGLLKLTRRQDKLEKHLMMLELKMFNILLITNQADEEMNINKVIVVFFFV